MRKQKRKKRSKYTADICFGEGISKFYHFANEDYCMLRANVSTRKYSKVIDQESRLNFTGNINNKCIAKRQKKKNTSKKKY